MDGSDERDFVARVRAAQERLQQRVRPTLFIPTTVRVDDRDRDIVVVYEGHQESGSYAMRPAYLKVLDAPPGKTIVCAARGNFAAAVACAARSEGRRAAVFVPVGTSRTTLVDIGRQHPRVLRRVTGSIVAVEEEARSFALRRDAHFVSGVDDESALIAAGTLAAEILAEVPDVTDLLVPTGGGALAGGMAEYFGDRLRVASVQTETATNVALMAQRPGPTRGLEAAQRWEVQPVSVRDAAAHAAGGWLWTHHDLPADTAAAAALAALMSNSYAAQPGGRIVVVVSGSNVNPKHLERR